MEKLDYLYRSVRRLRRQREFSMSVEEQDMLSAEIAEKLREIERVEKENCVE